MSFLKKLFGREASASSATEAKTTTGKGRLIDRSPRVQLTPLHRVTFTHGAGEANDARGAHTFAVSNISPSGMAILHSGSALLVPNQEIRGLLTVDGSSTHLSAEVRHLGARQAGLRFANPSQELQRLIESYLRIEISALKLRKVDEAYIKPDPRGHIFWFSDGRQNEFYGVVTEQKELLDFHMSFLGYYFQGGRDHELRGGHINEDDDREAPSHKSADLVDLNRQLTDEARVYATRFISNIDQLPVEILQAVQKQIASK